VAKGMISHPCRPLTLLPQLPLPPLRVHVKSQHDNKADRVTPLLTLQFANELRRHRHRMPCASASERAAFSLRAGARAARPLAVSLSFDFPSSVGQLLDPGLVVCNIVLILSDLLIIHVGPFCLSVSTTNCRANFTALASQGTRRLCCTP
jgi:hypothetical protein